MHDLVAEEGDQESSGGNDDDSSPARHVSIDCIEELSANNDVHCGPSNTSENVKDSNDFNTIPLGFVRRAYAETQVEHLLRKRTSKEPFVSIQTLGRRC